MSTIFISHSSADNELAVQLKERLERENHHGIFLDLDPEKGIVAGQSWERTLYRKLRACGVVIAILTDNYLKSQWCFAEIALARMEGKPILALRADPLEPDHKIPSIITEAQITDLRKDPEDGYRRLWRGLKEIDLISGVGDWKLNDSPYLGLSAFHEEHAPVFFGRDDEVRAGIELLDRGAPGMITILGASGSGKSSLARAGIVPRLKREPKQWIVVDPFRPGHDPLAELAQSLSQSFRRPKDDGRAAPASIRQPEEILRRLTDWQYHRAVERSEETETEPRLEAPKPADDERLKALLARLEALQKEPPTAANGSLLKFLDWSLEDLRRICEPQLADQPRARTSTPLVDIAYELRRSAGQRDAQVLLVIDQFEELLDQQAAESVGKPLLQLLAASLAVEKSPLKVLVTMRSDFLESFQKANARLGIDFETLSLGPMPVEGMRQVIEAPAKLAAIELETGLADALLKEAKSPDALPLLSFTLWLLWRDRDESDTITLKAYKALGGLEGAVAREADVIFGPARDKGREPALRKAFLELVRIADDGRYARQPVAWDTPELQPVHDLLDEFVDKRLLVKRAEGSTRVVEVAHESLFRTWTPLRGWIEEHRAEFLLKKQLRQIAVSWDKAGRPADYLWRGARLEQATELLRRGRLDSGAEDAPVSKEFVRASEDMRLRQSRRRRRIVVSVAAVLLAFLGFALVKENEAKIAVRRSWAQQQAAAALSLIETKPMDAVATARAAVCVTYTYDGTVLDEAQGALNRAVLAAQRQRILSRTRKDMTAGHSSAVTDVRFLPGAVADAQGTGAAQRMISLGRDRSILLWRMPGSGAPRCSAIPAPDIMADAIRRIVIDPGGAFLAVAATGGNVDLYDISDDAMRPALSAMLPLQGDVTAMTVAPDGRRMAVASQDGSVVVTPVSGGASSSAGIALPRQDARIVTLVFDATASRLATGGWDGAVKLWDSRTGALVHRFDGHTEAVTVLAAKDGLLASAGWDKSVRLWDMASGALLHSFDHDATVSALAFVPGDGASGVLVSASWDGTVRLWDVASGAMLRSLDHDAGVTALAVAPKAAPPGGQGGGVLRIATGDANGKVYLWTMNRGPAGSVSQDVVALHLEQVNDLSFSADGSRLASASDDKTIKVSKLLDQPGDLNWQSSLDVQHYGQEGASENWIAMIDGGAVQVLDAREGKVRRLEAGYDGNARRIAFSADGTSRLIIEADEIFEYYLDAGELMLCADQMADPALTVPVQGYSMAQRCAEIGRKPAFESIWTYVRNSLAGLR